MAYWVWLLLLTSDVVNVFTVQWEWVEHLPGVRTFSDLSKKNPVFDILRRSFDALPLSLRTLFMDLGFFNPGYHHRESAMWVVRRCTQAKWGWQQTSGTTLTFVFYILYVLMILSTKLLLFYLIWSMFRWSNFGFIME